MEKQMIEWKKEEETFTKVELCVVILTNINSLYMHDMYYF